MDIEPLPSPDAESKPATEHTRAVNAAVLEALPFANRQCFDDAKRGFIATLEPLTIERDNGRVAYDLSQFDFLQDEAPDTVNPSLWRQAQLNALNNGLYEVVDGIYQVRSFDIANMTLIRGDQGWVIIDPLTSSESARAALDLANEHLGERPVTGVIHTHSHVDHFGGVLGVVSHEDVESGRVPVIAPEHFVDESLSENVLAGNVMNRRATYMYGNLLKPGTRGFVSTGLGAALSMGSTGFVVPNDIVKQTGERRVVDGVEIEFQMTPGTEAPAEFVFFFPQFKALCMSEITSHHLHNVYTPRGAQVRDALAWSAQINESIELFGARLEVQFASHHWPIWGQKAAVEYLTKQRDLYKYIHDQTIRLANRGHTKEEIAERIQLPDSLGQEFYNRDYYGTVHHNTRAVYVKYLGYFDGNPAHLYPHEPVAAGERYVKYMGGAQAIVDKARDSFAEGDYRWVAEVLNHVVMAEPEHTGARSLLADTLEQLGYQSESGPWRNFFLCGAQELRTPVGGGARFNASGGIARGMPLENLFQLLAVRVLPERAESLSLSIAVETEETWTLEVGNSVLNAHKRPPNKAPDTTLRGDELAIKRTLLGLAEAGDAGVTISGDPDGLSTLLGLLDVFPRRFPIVTPREE